MPNKNRYFTLDELGRWLIFPVTLIGLLFLFVWSFPWPAAVKCFFMGHILPENPDVKPGKCKGRCVRCGIKYYQEDDRRG